MKLLRQIGKEELMKQVDNKMKESQLLKIVAKHGITIGLLTMLQAWIRPIVPTIGIVPEEDTSQPSNVEEPTSSAQAPSVTTIPVHEEWWFTILTQIQKKMIILSLQWSTRKRMIQCKARLQPSRVYMK